VIIHSFVDLPDTGAIQIWWKGIEFGNAMLSYFYSLLNVNGMKCVKVN